MTRIQTLSDLQPGQSATVRSVCAPDGMQRRLRDLGLIENTRGVCLGRSPMGDPSAYLIRGSDRAAPVRLPRHPRGRAVEEVRTWD